MAKLGEIFKISSGRSLPEKNRIKGKYNVYGGNGITGYHNDYFVNQSTIVIGRVGEYCGAVHLTSEKCWVTDNALMVTSWLTEVDKNYMAYLLNAKNLHQYAKTVGQPSISQGNIYDLEIPLPPLETQKQIAANLDKVTHTIDLCNNILEKLDLLVKARFVEMFGYPFGTEKWQIKQLEALSMSLVDGSNVNPTFYQSEGEVLFLRIQNVWRNEFRLDDSVYITQEINQNRYYDTSLKNGDLLITKIGRYYTKDSSLGRVSVYRGEDDCANYSNNIMRVRLKPTMNSEFINVLLNLDDYQSFIKRTSKGGTDKRALSKSLIGSYPIIVPPIELQNQFAAFVEQTDKSKSAVKQVLEKAETLKKALMQEYFG